MNVMNKLFINAGTQEYIKKIFLIFNLESY